MYVTFTIFSHSALAAFPFPFCAAIFLKFHFLTFATGLLPVETVNHKSRVGGGRGAIMCVLLYLFYLLLLLLLAAAFAWGSPVLFA